MPSAGTGFTERYLTLLSLNSTRIYTFFLSGRTDFIMTQSMLTDVERNSNIIVIFVQNAYTPANIS